MCTLNFKIPKKTPTILRLIDQNKQARECEFSSIYVNRTNQNIYNDEISYIF